jgi:hypothetical protein
MTINAKIVADSISEAGKRLTTLQLRYPKFIHGEAKTHRLMRIADRAYELLEEIGFMDDPNLSRNASSSRAIPVERLIKDVIDDPVYPSFWGKNQPGMQAAEECNELIHLYEGEHTREAVWSEARNKAIKIARAFAAAGYHKQIVNRLIEPFCHINVVVTATEWDNFFQLRCHPDAQPEMRLLAEAMRDAMAASTPKLLKQGEWHLPYIDQRVGGPDGDLAGRMVDTIKVSVARCARVSYLTQEGKLPKIEEDLKLYDKLVGSVPLHASPSEHQASPDQRWKNKVAANAEGWMNPELHGNFVGWIQHRKILEKEMSTSP